MAAEWTTRAPGLREAPPPTPITGKLAPVLVLFMGVLSAAPAISCAQFLRQHRVGVWPSRLAGGLWWVAIMSLLGLRLL
jgi:hypothetical protein